MTAAINLSCVPTPVASGVGSGNQIPVNALLDELGNPLFDEDGNYLLAE